MRTPTGVYHSHIHHRGEVIPQTRTSCVVSKPAPESQRKHTPHMDSERPQVMVFNDGFENPDGCRPQSHPPPGPKQNRLSFVVWFQRTNDRRRTTASQATHEAVFVVCSQNPRREHNILTFVTRVHSDAHHRGDESYRGDRRSTPARTKLGHRSAGAGSPVEETSSVALADTRYGSD